MTKENLIAEYERSHDLPEEERVVEYVPAFGKFLKKITVSQEAYEERYAEAKHEYDTNKKKKCIAVYKVVMEHNLTDQSSFNLKNVDSMIERFVRDEYKKKTVGIQIEDGEVIELLKYRQNEEFPELLPLPEILPEGALNTELMDIQYQWLIASVKEKEKDLVNSTKELINRSGSNLSARQDDINFVKEIKKAMENRNVFIDRKFEGYDFREVSLDSAIFIHCDLTSANFAHVNLQNTFFINCNMTDTIFYGAVLNNSYKVNGNIEKMRDKYEKFKM